MTSELEAIQNEIEEVLLLLLCGVLIGANIFIFNLLMTMFLIEDLFSAVIATNFRIEIFLFSTIVYLILSTLALVTTVDGLPDLDLSLK